MASSNNNVKNNETKEDKEFELTVEMMVDGKLTGVLWRQEF